MPISASPSPAPSPTPSTVYIPSGAASTSSADATTASQIDSKIDFSPPLIAMVIVIITAFLVITYSRLISKYVATPLLNRLRHWRRRRRRRSRLASSAGDLESFHPSNFNFVDQTDHFNSFSPYGLDDSVIKTIPLSVYNSKQSQKQNIVVIKDCAVCLLEFEENDYVRTLPVCSHSFHVDCIDIWLRSHANCPLCRARILISSASTSPFIPLMAGRIRPSLDGILDSILLEPLTEIQSENNPYSQTQTPEQPSTSQIEPVNTFDFVDRRNLLLKRSHSFSFDHTSTSPWRSITNPSASAYTTTSNCWNKRRLSMSSPFSALTKSRVFSFRSTRVLTTKSPFFNTARRTRNGAVMGLFSFSESASRRRSKWTVASPTAASSRLRCGDPEALLSPERYNRR